MYLIKISNIYLYILIIIFIYIDIYTEVVCFNYRFIKLYCF